MQRREFITLIGGAAVAWPLAANAQRMKFELLLDRAAFNFDMTISEYVR
jgi:hypothetical protein